MSSSGVSVLYAGTTRLYPRPYVSRLNQPKQDQKGAAKSAEPFANLDRLLALASSQLQQSPLPSHRWSLNATQSPSGTAHSVLLAQQTLVAIFFANRLQVFNLASSSRLFEFVFESPDGAAKWPITDVVECTLKQPEGTSEVPVAGHTMLVSVMISEQESRIYLIDFLSALTLIHVTVPFCVTKMLPSWNPTEMEVDQSIMHAGGLLSAFEMPLVLGTRGGGLMALDLGFDYRTLLDENMCAHSSAQLRHGLANYERESWKQSHDDALLHPWLDLTQAWIGEGNGHSDLFYYLNPRPGEFVGTMESAEPVPKSCVTITALQLLWPAPSMAETKSSEAMEEDTPLESEAHHSSATDFAWPSHFIPKLATPLVIVGFNFGTFQIWSLDSMELLYCSPITESRAAVTRFETQSLNHLIGTPSENKVLLWVARGSISTTHTQQAHPPNIAAYSLSLIMPGANLQWLGSPSPPSSPSDCIASVVSECSSNLESPFDGHYYGTVWLMQALPCWEARSLNNSSIAFVVETFPAQDSLIQAKHAPSHTNKPNGGPNRAGATHTSNAASAAPSTPPKAFECFILSTSSLQTESERLFIHPDQLTQLSMPYQLDPLNGDMSHLLSFNINPNSIQHYFPHVGRSRMSRETVERAQVSFDAVAVTEEAVWKIGYSSFGQQILNAIAEQGPVVFDHPELIDSLEHLNYVLPSSEEEAHHLREELFTLALHNNLGTVISDYVLDPLRGSLASLSISSVAAPVSSSLHQVLSWSRINYIQILETVHVLAKQLKGTITNPIEIENCALELRQAKRLLNELYNIIKALILRYQHQKHKWDAQEEVMQRDLDTIAVGSQFIDCCLFFAQNTVSYDFSALKAKVELRRARVAECAKNSPTAWDVTFDSNSPFVLNASGVESTRLKVSPRSFDENVDGLLLIDHLMAAIGVKETEESESYPPNSISAAVSVTRVGNPLFVAQKHQVIFYFLLDVDERMAVAFANRMMLTTQEQKLVRGLYEVDSNNYDEAMRYLNDSEVTGIISDDLALKILKTLNDVRAFPHALAFYRLRLPPLDSLDSIVLVLYIFLSNGLISDAFFMLRAHSRTTLDSFDPSFLHPLLFHFFNHSYHNHILKDVFQLPFDPIEADALKQFLLWCPDRSKSIDLHLVFLLQRSLVTEAVQWYHCHNASHNEPLDRDNELMKLHLLNNAIRSLPPSLRTSLPALSLPSFALSSQAKAAPKQALDLPASQAASNAPSSLLTPSKKRVTKLFTASRRQSLAHSSSSTGNANFAPFGSPGGASRPSSAAATTPSASTTRFAPAALGPALLSPTNPGRFARSPALFRPTIVLSTPSKGAAAPSGTPLASISAATAANAGPAAMDLDSAAPRPSLFSDRDMTANLISTPAKKIFANAQSAAGQAPIPISSTPAPSASIALNEPASQASLPTIVSQDSLIQRIDDVDDELVVMDMPTVPLSTPTKRVMDHVKLLSEEVRRQSKGIGKSTLVESGDDEEEDVIHMDVSEEVEEDEQDDEEQEEYEEEEEEAQQDQEEDEIDDFELEKIRGGASDDDDEEHYQQKQKSSRSSGRLREREEASHDDDTSQQGRHEDIEVHSRASRRSHASALSRLSELTGKSRGSRASSRASNGNFSKASRASASTATAHEESSMMDTSVASTSRRRGAAPPPRRSIRQRLPPLSEEPDVASSEHDPLDESHAASVSSSTRGRRRGGSAANPPSGTSRMDEDTSVSASMLSTPAGSVRSRRSTSSRAAESTASAPPSNQRRSTRKGAASAKSASSAAALSEETPVPLTEVSHRREPFRSQRGRAAPVEEEPTEDEEIASQTSATHKPARRSSRRSAVHVAAEEASDGEEQTGHANTTTNQSTTSSLGHQESHVPSGIASSSRRSSRLNKSFASADMQMTPVEPLGVHPEPYHHDFHNDHEEHPGTHDHGAEEEDDISGATIRIRRSSRQAAKQGPSASTPSSSTPSTANAPSAIASRTRSLRVKK
jgi:hypothetical protein